MLNFDPEIVGYQRRVPNFQPDLVRSNQRSIARHFEDLYYKKEFYPGDMEVGGAGATKIIVATRSSVVELADGALGAVYIKMRRPSEWIGGKARISLYYGGDAGSTANIYWQVQMNSIAVGDDYSTLLDIQVFETSPGPAAANTLAPVFTFANAHLLPVDQSHRFIDIKVERQGAHASDVYAGDVHLHMIVVELVQAYRQGHV